jgi:trimethylamine:corrinoid methyltransferase-like protein
VIAQSGPAGSFMIHPQTMKRMKNTALLASLADRNARSQWEAKGALDTHQRAMARVRDILSHASPAVFPAEVDSRIRAEFKDLVPGDLRVPEGW